MTIKKKRRKKVKKKVQAVPSRLSQLADERAERMRLEREEKRRKKAAAAAAVVADDQLGEVEDF